MAYFIKNPINKTVTSSSLANVTNPTFHRVVATVTIGGKAYKQSLPVNQHGQTVEFDLSSSLRAYAESINDGDAAVAHRKEYDAIPFSVVFTDEYMSGGKATQTENSRWSDQVAISGGYTDMERLHGAAEQDAESASYTMRPLTQMLLPEGFDYLCYRAEGEKRTASMRSAIEPTMLKFYTTGNNYEVPDNGRWQAFQFINTRGLHETAFAQCYSSEQIKGGTQTHVRALRETFSQMSHRLGIPDPSYAALSFSSGFVDLPWAKWWAYEFCKSKHHWMLIDGIWLPCKGELKDGASVINRTKAELLSVEFDVVPDVDGIFF